MLDQPVPNPLAKNPNVHTHKVFATVGLILLCTLVILGILAIIFRGEVGNFLKGLPINDPYKGKQIATKPATPLVPEEDETEDRKTYTNTSPGFSLKYPPDWLTTDCGPDPVFFAPKKDYLGVCNSGFGGLVVVSNIPTPGFAEVENNYVATNYDDFKKETTSVGGKTAVRISGISKINNEAGDERGTKVIVYLVELGPSFLSINYSQKKDWEDYSKEFEQMVSTFRFD